MCLVYANCIRIGSVECLIVSFFEYKRMLMYNTSVFMSIILFKLWNEASQSLNVSFLHTFLIQEHRWLIVSMSHFYYTSVSVSIILFEPWKRASQCLISVKQANAYSHVLICRNRSVLCVSMSHFYYTSVSVSIILFEPWKQVSQCLISIIPV